jgi:hypothetical protein
MKIIFHIDEMVKQVAWLLSSGLNHKDSPSFFSFDIMLKS